MNDTTKTPKMARTAEQKAEEKRIRELHRQQPIRVVPEDTLSGTDTAQLLAYVAMVRRERETQGLSVEQLAERAGIEASTLAQWESGQAFNASTSTLFRIARALGRNLILSMNGASHQAV